MFCYPNWDSNFQQLSFFDKEVTITQTLLNFYIPMYIYLFQNTSFNRCLKGFYNNQFPCSSLWAISVLMILTKTCAIPFGIACYPKWDSRQSDCYPNWDSIKLGSSKTEHVFNKLICPWVEFMTCNESSTIFKYNRKLYK